MTAPTTQAPSARGLAGALPTWASGIVTGAVAALASLLVVLAPALAALASAPQQGASADWGAGASVATRLWLLGLGVPLKTSDGAFSLVPLGLTVVILAILVATAQRFLLRSWSAVALAIATFATLVGFAASLASSGVEGSSSVTTRAVVGAVVVGVPGIVVGRVRAHGLTIDVLERIPREMRSGVRFALASTALALVVAASVGAVSALLGASTMADTVTALDADIVGAGVLSVGQLLYVPTLAVWMLAWVSGVGFSVGDGTVYSPSEVVVGDLPQLPLLGALPQGAGGALVWAPLLLVAVGIIVRVALRSRVTCWRDEATVLVVSAAGMTAAFGILMASASGAAGPGRLADVGPPALSATGAAVGLVLAGHLVIAVVAGLARRGRGGVTAARRPVEDQPPGDSRSR